MGEGSAYLGVNLGVIAVVAGVLPAAMAALGVPWTVWAGFFGFMLLWLWAMLGLSDRASRLWMAKTLRDLTYTQIYTTLTRRLLMPIWGRVCDPVEDAAGVVPLARAALTWRLYDAALLIAVAYPILLPVGQWVVTGAAARVGSFEFLPAAPFWWDRVATVGALAILILGFVARTLAAASQHRVIRQAADWLPVLVAGAVFAVAGTATAEFLAALAAAFAVAVAFKVTGAFAAAAALALAVTVAGTTAGAIAGAIAGAVAVAVVAAGDGLHGRGHPRAARWMLTVVVSVAVLGFFALFDMTTIPRDRGSWFLFLAVLPLLNALFDTVSYAVTLTLMRRGLRSPMPLLCGLLDLALACLLFLALGCTLVVAIHGLNGLAGVPLVDLPALLAGVYTQPGDYVWLYLMLFSTILPTALHGLLSLFGLQGIWPRFVRRPLAVWVAGATDSPVAAVRAALALAGIWTLPLVLLGGLVWALWAPGGDALLWALGQYFDLLLRLAAIPSGAV